MRVFISVIVMLLSVKGMAQKYELGKVTVDELKEKAHPKDTSAVAAILFQKGKTEFFYSPNGGFKKTTEVACKIKIYKKEGYEWANQQIKYYLDGDFKEKVFFSDAVTYNLADGKIVKSKLKNDGEFDEKINRFWGKKKIVMPNVKEGSIVEFKYLLESLNFGDLTDWDFQYNIPVNYSEYTTWIPEYFTYKENQKGFIFPKKTVKNANRFISITSKERSNAIVGAQSNISTEKIDYVETQTTYTLNDVPALNDEKYVSNIKNYTSSISHELASVQYPNSPAKFFSTDWENVTKKIYEADDFGPELNKTGYFENEVKEIISGLTNQDQKISAIFDFVKSKVKWNEYYGYSCSDGVKTAYKNNTGNVAEINLMLTAMLRYAGIAANPVLLSTRSNGITFFPSRNAFNYVIAAVEIQDGLILLDATDKNALPNILPFRDLNWFGRIIRKEGSSANVELMPKTVSKQITNAMLSIDNDGKVSGKVREQYFDYQAYSFRDNYGDVSRESYLESLEKMNNGIEVDQYECLNVKDLSKPVVENYSFNSSNLVEVLGDKMYFSPMLFFAWSKNPFIQEKREYPIDFGYPTQDKYTISIAIPEGYAIESIPESKAISLPEGMGLFKLNVAKSEKQVQLVLSRDFSTPIISAEYYDAIKQFFDMMVKSETDKVVLKKA